jgi:8-amino-7-oxononanoate synthase
LYFGGGYVANFAIFSTLPQTGDLIVHDELIHASVHEGLRRGRADFVAVPHNNVDAFDAAIVRWRKAGGKGRPWLSVETFTAWMVTVPTSLNCSRWRIGTRPWW